VSFLSTDSPLPGDQKQSRLMQMATAFLLVYSIILTLAPAVRLHSWQVSYRWNHWIGFGVWLIATAIAHDQVVQRQPERDPYLFPIGAILSGWGLLTIWRLDAGIGARQTAWLAFCLLVFSAGLRVPHLVALLRRYKYVWLTGGLLLTGLTFIFGTYPGGIGPHLWLGCCGLYLQPSEPLKLLLIAYLAAYLADRLPVSFSLPQLLAPTLILIGAALALLVGQRDLGTASLFILIYTVVIYLASQRRRVLGISLLILVLAGVAGYLLFDVVRIRVDAWIAPWLDPAGRSYQIVQSIIAVANGQVLGRGPGLGSPGVVPVAHSDFIFASIAEENGLLGSIALLGIYALLVSRGFRAAIYAANNFSRYLAAGITAYLAIQGIFIMGGNLRLLPLTGVTLPFVSYGGSSLLTAFISLLLLTIVSTIREEEEIAPLPNPGPYLLVSGGLLLGLFALALTAGWWAVARSSTLLARPENPRRVITERYVQRGALIDRNNRPITTTIGSPGDYRREYDYPQLSDTTGYNHPLYGQAGLESGLDGYLRGLVGTPSTMILADELLYGQTPPGLNVRLTIDLEIQEQADSMLQGHHAALVLLNAQTGEILVISSHPNFDPNRMDEIWLNLLQDPNAPLFNRATQGQYPPGAALGPFLLAYAESRDALPNLPNTLTYASPSGQWLCAQTPGAAPTIGQAISSGCPAPLVALGNQAGAKALEDLFASLGFYEKPEVPLLTADPSQPGVTQVDMAALGQENLSVTPLQMALAAATLSSSGSRPSPQIAAAILPPQQDWQILPNGPGQATLLAAGTQKAAEALAASGNASYWQTVALAHSNKEELTWYLAGTLPNWQGAPLALAVVLEENNPELAQQIGQGLLKATLK
jgi:cell division protein FtsW (lipid II flippase)